MNLEEKGQLISQQVTSVSRAPGLATLGMLKTQRLALLIADLDPFLKHTP